MEDHEPSDIIPLFNGMTISFINYELQVKIEPKTPEEQARSVFETLDLHYDLGGSHIIASSIIHEAPKSHREEVKHEEH